MIRWLLRWILLPLALLLLLIFGAITLLSEGVTGERHPRGEVSSTPRPAAHVASRDQERRATAESLRADPSAQILFGDLHVHTTYSGDAFIFSLPLMQGEGVHPPADACDFARFCSELDFWSINDHAEYITPWQWSETKESIRECNAVAGDPENPDMVSFLGWEWTQSANSPESSGGRRHYGHKNVILLETEDERVPTRPIGAGEGGLFSAPVPSAAWAVLRVGMTLGDLGNLQPYMDFNTFARDVRAMEACPKDTPVRDLPADCLEGAETPKELFSKLEDWGFRSLVIPHGTSWGIHAPVDSDLANQLRPGENDSTRQRLFEVYSGHGASERVVPMVDAVVDEAGQKSCAAPTDDYLPCCWQAGEIIRGRCEEPDSERCQERIAKARESALDHSPFSVVEGTRPNDWLDCGQPRTFLAAYEYRPNMSAQYGLASRRPEQGSEEGAFRFGLIGSSDNHKARPGPGYKEVGRKAFGDAYGFRDDWTDLLTPEQTASPEPAEEPSAMAGLATTFERGASFYYTSGLVAVHAASRGRGEIFDALERRQAYGTSGPRILLWFDLENGPNGSAPMGSEVFTAEAPSFTVRAAGSFEQKPGCPETTTQGLSAERLQRLCRGECYHPSDRRVPIERIEVVRVRPQIQGDESIPERIDDPWRTFECTAGEAGCQFEFSDPEYDGSQEFLYYVRALQAPTPAINGDPVRCDRDARGRCLKARACPASGPDFDPADECLADVRERAWSSPIWLRPPKEAAGRG
ncbi:MAG: DUF3604 domain-containing protein [bacterium]|nr:DUF3604 domain-containing protein [bacterium]